MQLSRSPKRYVDVVARWHADGYVEPLIVCWPDGRSFQIESVDGRPQSTTFPNNPGRTLRYTVLVNGVRTQLFLERDADAAKDSARWYVERKPSQQPWSVLAG